MPDHSPSMSLRRPNAQRRPSGASRPKALAALAAVAVIGTLAAACSDDGGAVGERISLATYNAGLAPNFVSFVAERRSQTIAAAAGIEADVVCLQEVWTDEDVAATEAAAKAAGFTTVYVAPTKEDVSDLPVACTEGDTKDLAPCAQAHCVPSDNLVECVQSKCGAELAALSPTCLGCLASNLHLDFDGILGACAKGGGKLTFGGRHGLMLLSRLPLEGSERMLLDSTLIQRAVLHARVVGDADHPSLDVYCTHLTAGLSSIPYTGDLGGWEAEQAGQIDELGAWIDSTAKPGGAVALLGDLNCGPAIGETITAEMPANWQKVLALGFSDPYTSTAGALCTFCGDNTLVAAGADKGGEGAIIDHIALRGFAGGASAGRIIDQKVSIETSSGTQQSHLSDHFGVRVLLAQ
jgi:endonuclease/exonuclease/phosphatase family metal-dependent hydrolase